MKDRLFIKNLSGSSCDFYLYGAIVSEKWWNEDVSAKDVRDAIEGIEDNGTLNLYVNSPGGDVFTASAICSMLERAKGRGIKIKAFVDGLAASAASFIIMEADEIVLYNHSMLMVHKPWSCCCGNADDMLETAKLLDTLQTSVMMPLYKKKALVEMDVIREKVDNETWLTADEVVGLFDCILSDDASHQAAALIDRSVLDNYKNVPEALKEQPKPEPIPEPTPAPVDYSYFEQVISELKTKGDKNEQEIIH